MFNKLNALILTIVDFVLSEAIDTKRGPRVFIFFSVILPRAKRKRFIQFVSWISIIHFPPSFFRNVNSPFRANLQIWWHALEEKMEIDWWATFSRKISRKH